MDGMGIPNEEDTYNKMDGERGQVEKWAVCSRTGAEGVSKESWRRKLLVLSPIPCPSSLLLRERSTEANFWTG